MVELDQFKVKIGNYEEPLSELKESLGLDMKQERIDQLEAQMEEPNFWDDVTSSQFVMKELKQLKSVVESYETLEAERDDILTMIEMGYEEDDDDEEEEKIIEPKKKKKEKKEKNKKGGKK